MCIIYEFQEKKSGHMKLQSEKWSSPVAGKSSYHSWTSFSVLQRSLILRNKKIAQVCASKITFYCNKIELLLPYIKSEFLLQDRDYKIVPDV